MLLRSFEPIGSKKLDAMVETAFNRYRFKQALGKDYFYERSIKIEKISQQLKENKQKLAELITTEIGKPIEQSKMEIDSCMRHLNYYIENGQHLVAGEVQ